MRWEWGCWNQGAVNHWFNLALMERGMDSHGPRKSQLDSLRVNNFSNRERSNKSRSLLMAVLAERKVMV